MYGRLLRPLQRRRKRISAEAWSLASACVDQTLAFGCRLAWTFQPRSPQRKEKCIVQIELLQTGHLATRRRRHLPVMDFGRRERAWVR